MPDLMRFCERWIGSTKIQMLPEGFRDVCPKGEFNKLVGVRGFHHFWKQSGVIHARAYSHFGPVKEVQVETGVKRAVSFTCCHVPVPYDTRMYPYLYECT